MNRWQNWITGMSVEGLFRSAGARVTLIELAESWNLPDVERFAADVNRLADELDTHIRERYRELKKSK